MMGGFFNEIGRFVDTITAGGPEMIAWGAFFALLVVLGAGGMALGLLWIMMRAYKDDPPKANAVLAGAALLCLLRVILGPDYMAASAVIAAGFAVGLFVSGKRSPAPEENDVRHAEMEAASKAALKSPRGRLILLALAFTLFAAGWTAAREIAGGRGSVDLDEALWVVALIFTAGAAAFLRALATKRADRAYRTVIKILSFIAEGGAWLR